MQRAWWRRVLMRGRLRVGDHRRCMGLSRSSWVREGKRSPCASLMPGRVPWHPYVGVDEEG